MKKLLCLVAAISSLPIGAVSNEGEYSPAWSPDGQYLAYHKNSDSVFWDLLIKNVNTGEITQVSNNKAYDTGASWSPDGQQLIFSSSRSGNRDIYVYNLSTKQSLPLIQHESMDNQANWSPDGSTIAFLSRRNGKSQLYLYDIESKKTRQLTDTGEHIFHPSWSPDGHSIFFDQQVDDKSRIFRVNIKEGAVSEVYSNNASTFSASSDGEKLTLSTNRSGQWDIIRVDLRNGKEETLIATPNNEMKGVWDADGRRIAYSQQNAQGIWEVKIKTVK